MLYLWLKTFHVLLAVIAVGFSASYGLIIGRARKAGRTELTFALKTVQAMGDYVANPSFVLLLLTGFAMIRMSGLPIGTRPSIGSPGAIGWQHANVVDSVGP